MSIQQMLFCSESSPTVVATGGQMYTVGNYITHVFTASGTFTISQLNDYTVSASVFLVGGGYDGQSGEDRYCDYSGGDGGNGGNGGYWKKYENYQFQTLFGTGTGNITITVGGVGDNTSGFSSGGGYWSYNGTQKAGGSGGPGAPSDVYGTSGGNGLGSESVTWPGFTIDGGASGGGGGGGPWWCCGGGPGSGGSGGAGGGGSGGQGANSGDGFGGNSGVGTSVYGCGGGGGGGAQGEGDCQTTYYGGVGAGGKAGVVVIYYRFK